MLVTGRPPNFGGGGMSYRIFTSSRPPLWLRTTGAWEYARKARQISGAVDGDSEKRRMAS
jgi:hypothetical protein